MLSINEQLDFWALTCRIHEAGYNLTLHVPDWKAGLVDACSVTIVALFDDAEVTFQGTGYLACTQEAVEFAEANPSIELL